MRIGKLFLVFVAVSALMLCSVTAAVTAATGFRDAAAFGFSPEAEGMANAKALQKAVEGGGTVVVSQPGTYKIGATVYLGSNTSLVFGSGVFLKKVDEKGPFTHVLLNRGALTKEYDHNITVDGLHIIVNGVDKAMTEVYGLRGQIAFFYVKDLKITRFRCLDLAVKQFCIHVCTFEDLIIDDVIIRGEKDGIHMGRGNRFTIRNCVFDTYDDAIGLNAQDYANSNPEVGWIENGVVENCYDTGKGKCVGNFCRMLAGGWTDWQEGMEVQHSDAVVSEGRIYRVQASPNGEKFVSKTRPVHKSGQQTLDGIRWGVVQEEVLYSAGVRNVSFRNIFLEKPRTGFAIHFDNNKFNRSYYPGAEVPVQEHFVFENVRVAYPQAKDLFAIRTPVDAITVIGSSIRNNRVAFYDNRAMTDYFRTNISFIGCTFLANGDFKILENNIAGKKIILRTSSSMVVPDDFRAVIGQGGGIIGVDSDLNGLRMVKEQHKE